MKRGSVTIVALALALAGTLAGAAPAQAAPTAAAAAVCPDGNNRAGVPGQRIKSSTSATVYMVDPEGYARPIPDPETYFRFFRGWNGLITTPDTDCTRKAAGFDAEDFLAKDSAGGYYFMDFVGKPSYYVARHIVSVAVYDKYNFSWSTPVQVPDSYIATHLGKAWT